MNFTPRTPAAALLIAFLFILSIAVPASALSGDAEDFLLKTAPRPAGMGGAFTAVPGDPIGMMWNPSAAMRLDRFAVSGNHSLRHFPGPRKNLDQMDSDTMALLIPIQSDTVFGAGFTVPGEWGVDYMDTNGVLPEKERFRGRERRIALADLRQGVRHTVSGYADSNWYRRDHPAPETGPVRRFQTGAGFSFYYETDNGMMYGFNVRGLVDLIRKKPGAADREPNVKVTLGAAYREDDLADTLAAVDVELHWKDDDFAARWFGGAERSFDKERYFLRMGNMDGSPTYGAGARFGSLRLDYALIKNFLPKITGRDDVTLFQDAHTVSYTLTTN